MQNPQHQLLEKFVDAVFAAPKAVGLTATDTPKEFWERHVLDALKIVSLIPQKDHERHLNVIDVGSGNGVPGIPIAIACPAWKVVLLDSNNKKCGFLDAFCKSNAIKNVRVVAGHAEDYSKDEEARDQFELGFARALSKLPVALELVLPFIKREGRLVIPHGGSYASEISRSEKTMKELGAVLQSATPYEVVKGVTFVALTFLKTESTPDQFPRRVGLAKRKPL